MSRSSLKNIHRLIEAATSEVPVNESFVADLNRVIELTHAEHARKPSKSYKPSSMKCVRNMYFQVTGTEPDPSSTTAELVGIMHIGSTRHEFLQEAVSSMRAHKIDCDYIDVETYINTRGLTDLKVVSKNGYETKVFHTRLNISFLCDGIIKYKGHYYILEIKTEASFKWQSRQGTDEEHVAQGTTYAICFGINDIMYLYESRDTTAKKAYFFKVTDDMKFNILSKIELSDQHVKQLIPPPISADLPKRACTYCNYKEACKRAGN